MSTHKTYSVRSVRRLLIAAIAGWAVAIAVVAGIIVHTVHERKQEQRLIQDERQREEDTKARIEALLQEKRMSKLRMLIRENNPRLSYSEVNAIAYEETTSAIKKGIDPNLMHALSMQESRWNPNAATWCCEGIRQLHYNVHKDKYGFDSREQLKDPIFNIQKGTEFFADLLKMTKGDERLALQRYYGSTDPSQNVWYMNQVLAKREYIERKLS